MIFSFWRTFFFWITICWTYKRKCHYVELLMLTHLKIMKTILIKIKFLLNLLHSTKTISEEQCESCMQNNYSTELWGILKTAGNKSQKISWSFFFSLKGEELKIHSLLWAAIKVWGRMPGFSFWTKGWT